MFIFPYSFIANFPLDVVKNLPEDLSAGIYFGWANVDNGDVHKAVLSIGWNPFYDNKEKSMVCICFIDLMVPKCMPYLFRSTRVVIIFQVEVSTFLHIFKYFLLISTLDIICHYLLCTKFDFTIRAKYCVINFSYSICDRKHI